MRLRSVVSVVAVLAAIACAGCDPKLAEAASTAKPSPTPTVDVPEVQPHSKVPFGDLRGPDVNGWRAVTLYGLTVDVPAVWPANATRCSTPIADTVVVEPYVENACALNRPPKVDSVTLRPTRPHVETTEGKRSTRSINGYPLSS